MSEKDKAQIVRTLYFRKVLDDADSGDAAALADLIRSDLRFGLFSSYERESLADLVVTLCKRARRRPKKPWRKIVVDYWRDLRAEAKSAGTPRPDKERYISVCREVLAKKGIKVAETTLRADLDRSIKNFSK